LTPHPLQVDNRRLLRYAIDDPENNQECKDELRDTDDAEVASQLEDHGLEIRRIALIESDCTALGRSLSFPASDKIKDTRYPWFVSRFGDQCWELDAMNPNDLRARVTEAIVDELDIVAWDRYVAAEEAERESIMKTLTTWKSLSRLAPETGPFLFTFAHKRRRWFSSLTPRIICLSSARTACNRGVLR
jgi:hypothetical protein